MRLRSIGGKRLRPRHAEEVVVRRRSGRNYVVLRNVGGKTLLEPRLAK
ncbi:hypothetical protein THTE_2094 [Thermogutta terrifontis]|uniref:Uncharacterized protein n=1 Tax=Thermogutta terrifontis TaxID=1331910 RepID=A0A286RFF7_9BACT|nr:hypothetical protein THTE_2094 [Thermogutta terrifontis]